MAARAQLEQMRRALPPGVGLPPGMMPGQLPGTQQTPQQERVDRSGPYL
jgi:hypothetical protein